MKAILKEPLVYFLLISGLLFTLAQQDNTDQDAQHIVVDKASILSYIQQKSKLAGKDQVLALYQSLSKERKQAWIDAYVREEALYREAMALKLDDNDPIIKGRVIQKLEFISKEYSEAVLTVSDANLEAYFAENKQDYFIEPSVTFTHVFISKQHHQGNLQALAEQRLQELNNNKVGFNEGARLGDRFPYHVNYVEKSPGFIASHFDKNMADSIFAVQQTGEFWQGPFESQYGMHLLMVTQLDQGRLPKLAEVRNQVFQDTQRQQIQQNLQDTYQSIIDTYKVSYLDIWLIDYLLKAACKHAAFSLFHRAGFSGLNWFFLIF